jgi:soluble lytic murein transglycosylase-like protein
LGIEHPSDIENSKSSDGKSWGLMQMTIKTARGLDSSATEEKLNDPDFSIDLSARYIAQLMGMFSSSDERYVEWVVKSYNQGPGNTKKEMKTGVSYAQEYWDRWLRNYNRVGA